MPTANAFLEVALSQVGYTEYPAGSNNTKYGAWYGMNYQPWCDMFVSWCGAECGAADIVGHFALCKSHAAWFIRRGQWHDLTETPQPGDVVFFGMHGSIEHVGIVRGVDGGDVLTVEGNTSRSSNDNGGAVMLRRRGLGDPYGEFGIFGYGRPDWREVELTPEDCRMVAAYVLGYEIDGVSVADRLRSMPHDAAIEALGYVNEAMNGDADVYQLITDTRRLAGWDYKNPRLEGVDAYQILRDVRDGVNEVAEDVDELNQKIL